VSEVRTRFEVVGGALARAGDYGAKALNRELLAMMPGVFMLAGEAQARGVYLDGYGVYFDVQVPMMRQSMMWSVRTMLDQDNTAAQMAISDMRKIGQSITDPATRAAFERSLKQLESQSTPANGYARTAHPGNAGNPALAAPIMLPNSPCWLGSLCLLI